MAKTVRYYIDVDANGAVKGGRTAEDALKGVDKQAKKSGDSLLSLNNIALLTAAGGLGIAMREALSQSIEKGSQFESQLANLEAITGITGTQLSRLGSRSLDLSQVYGTSASNIIEANKLVASQLAEKIDFGTEEGFQILQKVSEETVVLSKAAGIDLSDAVATTTSIINQFNLEADESQRVINTLAAGAKFGAAEVPEIGTALINAGSAAAGANASIEETNALIQVLAANGQVGERAGTALRAIFLRLQTSGSELAQYGLEEVDIKANGVNETLRQLAPIMENATALKELFGEEAFNAASILIREAESVENLTQKVTGTNTAYDQASVQMDTFEGATARLQATIDASLIPAFTESNGVLVQLINNVAGLIDQFAGGLSVINDWMDMHSDLRKELGLGTSATDLQIQAMNALKEELAQAAIEANLSADQQLELAQAYTQSTEALKVKASAIYDETALLKSQREEIALQIEQLEEANAIEGAILARKFGKGILELRNELEALNLSIASNDEQFMALMDSIEDGSITLEQFISKFREAQALEFGMPPLPEIPNPEPVDIPLEFNIGDLEVPELAIDWDSILFIPDGNLDRLEQSLAKIDLMPDATISNLQDKLATVQDLYVNAQTDAERERLAVVEEHLAYEMEAKRLGVEAEELMREDSMERKKELFTEYTSNAITLASSLADLQSTRTDAQITKLEKQKKKELEIIDKKLSAENLSEKEKTKLLQQRESIENSYEERKTDLQRQQFEKEKRAKQVMAIAETALSVVEASPNIAKMVMAGAVGAIQLAIISAQANPYLEGGLVQERMPEGKTTPGKKVISINEDGRAEYVVNADSTQMFEEWLHAMNYAPESVAELMANYSPGEVMEILNSNSSAVDHAFLEGGATTSTSIYKDSQARTIADYQRVEQLSRMPEGKTTPGKKVISINEDGRAEYVVNADSTQLFEEWLHAMNYAPESVAELMANYTPGEVMEILNSETSAIDHAFLEGGATTSTSIYKDETASAFERSDLITGTTLYNTQAPASHPMQAVYVEAPNYEGEIAAQVSEAIEAGLAGFKTNINLVAEGKDLRSASDTDERFETKMNVIF